MTKNTRFSPEVRQRAIRMVLESQVANDEPVAANVSISP
ncbi:transposase, partial [Escherichia coli]